MSNRDRNNSRVSSKNASKGGSSSSKDNPKDKPQRGGSARTSPQITPNKNAPSIEESWEEVLKNSLVFEEKSDIGMCSTMLGIPAMDIPSDPNLSNEVGSSEITVISPQTGRRITHRQLPVTPADVSDLQSDSERQTINPVDFKNSGRAQSSMIKGIKMSAPSLSIRSDELNSISGASSSSILPSVDIDKSFDMPICDISNQAGAENESTPKREISSTRHKIDVMSVKPVDESIIESEPTSIIDLSNLPDSTKHYEDATTIRRLQKSFIQSQLFDDRRFRMLGRLINFRSLDCARDVEALMGYLSSTYQNENPVIVQLRSSCDFGRESVLRAFLQRCNKELESFRTYAEIYAADGSSCDLVTSLIASRIALFPHEEETHKISRILGAAEEALNLEDQRWGVDILFIRYGLRQYVSNNKTGLDISALVNRNESDMIELLESMIIHDASQGPVVLIFSVGDTEKQTVWRDLIYHLKRLPVSNVLIILNGGTSQIDLESIDIATHEVAPLTERDCMLIINQLLPYLSQDDLTHLAAKCGGNLTQLKRVMRIFQRQNPLENPNPLYEDANLLKFIDSLPDNPTALSHTYYNSFSTDECRFLNVASIMGGRFYLNDLTTLLSLEPLPDEIPGFKDLRSGWCEHIASQLMESGEIFMIHQDEKRGIRFEFPEYKLFENLSTRMDNVSAQRLHGSFARILERGGAPETRIATQFEAANMWPEAATHWLSVARRYSRNFYDQTSYAILKTCLHHIGPQYEDIYPALLRECMTLSCHIGRYEDVCYYADQLIRIGKMLSDTRCMAKAFIDMSNALRIQGNYQRAKEMAQYGLELAEKLGDDVLISLSNHTMAQIIFDSGAKGSLVNALRYAEKALETRRHLGDLSTISHTQTLCSRIYIRRGEPARAKTAANEAYHALMACGHWYETPIVLTSLARSTSALQEAMLDDYLERGFAIVEKTGDVEHQFELLTAHLLLTVNTLQRQSVRANLDAMRKLIKSCPVTPWTAIYHLLTAMFDFSRKNFQKTTKALRCFFDAAQKLDNSYIMALGYSLSAELNFEVYKRNLSSVSIEKTEKLYISATSLFESVGAWHEVARTLRLYASFLDAMDRREDAHNSLKRADKVDPYRQM